MGNISGRGGGSRKISKSYRVVKIVLGEGTGNGDKMAENAVKKEKITLWSVVLSQEKNARDRIATPVPIKLQSAPSQLWYTS